MYIRLFVWGSALVGGESCGKANVAIGSRKIMSFSSGSRSITSYFTGHVKRLGRTSHRIHSDYPDNMWMFSPEARDSLACSVFMFHTVRASYTQVLTQFFEFNVSGRWWHQGKSTTEKNLWPVLWEMNQTATGYMYFTTWSLRVK